LLSDIIFFMGKDNVTIALHFERLKRSCFDIRKRAQSTRNEVLWRRYGKFRDFLLNKIAYKFAFASFLLHHVQYVDDSRLAVGRSWPIEYMYQSALLHQTGRLQIYNIRIRYSYSDQSVYRVIQI